METAERLEVVNLYTCSNPTLNKAEIRAEGGITQPFQVLKRSLEWQDFQSYSAASQYFLIFLGISVEDAAFRTACDGDYGARSHMKEPVNR